MILIPDEIGTVVHFFLGQRETPNILEIIRRSLKVQNSDKFGSMRFMEFFINLEMINKIFLEIYQ